MTTDPPRTRGPDSEDPRAFSAAAVPSLRCAVHDLGWLLGRGYAMAAATTLVGDHLQLSRRQRAAVSRCAAAPDAIVRRAAHRVMPDGRDVWIDALNLLVTVERALDGGPVLRGADGVLRDVAGVHGTWKPVASTPEAVRRIGLALAGARITWLIDAPVSNSGRLAEKLRSWGTWEVEVVASPDALLRRTDALVCTADAAILDVCAAWVDVTSAVVAEVPAAWVVDLRP